MSSPRTWVFFDVECFSKRLLRQLQNGCDFGSHCGFLLGTFGRTGFVLHASFIHGHGDTSSVPLAIRHT